MMPGTAHLKRRILRIVPSRLPPSAPRRAQWPFRSAPLSRSPKITKPIWNRTRTTAVRALKPRVECLRCILSRAPAQDPCREIITVQSLCSLSPSAIVTATIAITVFIGVAKHPAALRLEELTVQRPNVAAPDGAPRMLISAQHDFSGTIINEHAYPFQRDTAGILFDNEADTENGGVNLFWIQEQGWGTGKPGPSEFRQIHAGSAGGYAGEPTP